MVQLSLKRIWGGATALFERYPRLGWIDLLVLIALGGALYGLADLAHEWTGAHRTQADISLSPWALPRYTFFSLMRGLSAYALSLGFTLVYGYWAAKDRMAERVLIPMLDILQSIPVLAFMPGLLLALAALFPRSNIGLEMASIILIFTGQAWNMTFSFYHSIKSVPLDQQEVATVYRFSWWEKFRWVELPYSTMGLVWNSMMSMAGGWFFLIACEAFKLRDEDFRVPGIGSYMSEAVDAGKIDAMVWAVIAMVLMIVMLDQLLWRPVVAWAQKFRVEEGGAQESVSSWFLDWLRRSQLLRVMDRATRAVKSRLARVWPARAAPTSHAPDMGRVGSRVSLACFLLLLLALGFGAVKLVELLWQISRAEWRGLGEAALWTLGRVLISTAIGTLWALPAGLVIGLSPKLSRILQPVIQVVASFPAPMLFPLLIAGLTLTGVPLGWGSILLMLLGTQWYILFNVIAGAMAIPADLREAAQSYRIRGWQRFWTLYVPSIFPFLVTGWVTAAGGAWNASIISEYVTYKKEVIKTIGLGAEITAAVEAKNSAMLAASVLVMALLVVTFNRTVWKRCYRLAEERFSLNR